MDQPTQELQLGRAARTIGSSLVILTACGRQLRLAATRRRAALRPDGGSPSPPQRSPEATGAPLPGTAPERCSPV